LITFAPILEHYSSSIPFGKMVDIKVEATEPDPSASSIVNDNTINNDSTAATDPILGESTDAGDRKATEAAKEIIAEIKAKEKEGDGTDSKEAGESNGTADESISEKEVHGSLKPDQTMTVAPEIKKEINGDAKPYDKTTAPGDGNTGDRRAGNKRGGYQGGRKFEDYRKNVKTDFTAQKESSDPDEIRKQVKLLAYSDTIICPLTHTNQG